MKASLKINQKYIFTFLIYLTFYACGPEPCDVPCDDSKPVLETIFYGIFDNEWEVEGTDDYIIGLFRDEDSQDTSSGVLQGHEDHPVHGFNSMINGTFDGLDLEFTIPRNEGAENVVFSGTMTPTSETDHNIIRIDLTTSENENLVLKIN